jgi:hypothetical protein
MTEKGVPMGTSLAGRKDLVLAGYLPIVGIVSKTFALTVPVCRDTFSVLFVSDLVFLSVNMVFIKEMQCFILEDKVSHFIFVFLLIMSCHVMSCSFASSHDLSFNFFQMFLIFKPQ